MAVVNRHRRSPHRTEKKSDGSLHSASSDPSVTYKQKLAAEENMQLGITKKEFDDAIIIERKIARQEKRWGFAFGIISGIFASLIVFAVIKGVG